MQSTDTKREKGMKGWDDDGYCIFEQSELEKAIAEARAIRMDLREQTKIIVRDFSRIKNEAWWAMKDVGRDLGRTDDRPPN